MMMMIKYTIAPSWLGWVALLVFKNCNGRIVLVLSLLGTWWCLEYRCCIYYFSLNLLILKAILDLSWSVHIYCSGSWSTNGFCMLYSCYIPAMQLRSNFVSWQVIVGATPTNVISIVCITEFNFTFPLFPYHLTPNRHQRRSTVLHHNVAVLRACSLHGTAQTLYHLVVSCVSDSACLPLPDSHLSLSDFSLATELCSCLPFPWRVQHILIHTVSCLVAGMHQGQLLLASFFVAP